MKAKRGSGFAKEMARIIPLMLREVTKRQENIMTRGSLAVSHILVLDFLARRVKCRMTELAGTLNLTMSAATAIVDKMVKARLVKRERAIDDRRVVEVRLLKRGIKTAENVNAARIVMIDELYTALTAKERREYLRLIRKVYGSLKRKRAVRRNI